VLYLTRAGDSADGTGAGTERVLLDPSALDPTGRTTLDAWVPDLEGASCLPALPKRERAVGAVRAGCEHRRQVQPPIDRCRYSSVTWLPRRRGVRLRRMVAATRCRMASRPSTARSGGTCIGADPETDELIDGPGLYVDHTYYGQRFPGTALAAVQRQHRDRPANQPVDHGAGGNPVSTELGRPRTHELGNPQARRH